MIFIPIENIVVKKTLRTSRAPPKMVMLLRTMVNFAIAVFTPFFPFAILVPGVWCSISFSYRSLPRNQYRPSHSTRICFLSRSLQANRSFLQYAHPFTSNFSLSLGAMLVFKCALTSPPKLRSMAPPMAHQQPPRRGCPIPWPGL